MTPQQQKILNALTEHGELSKSELKEIIGSNYDSTLETHISKLLAGRKIKRVKQGVYALDRSNYTDPKQTSLFGE